MSSKKKKTVALKPSVGYVLLKFGWEYNDEYYFRPDQGGGEPVKIFTNKADAKAEYEVKNLEEFKDAINDGIRNYGYDYTEVIKAGTESKFTKLVGSSPDEWFENDCPPPTLTDKEWVAFMTCFELTFFEVVEVEFGNSTKTEVDEDEIEHLKKVLEL